MRGFIKYYKLVLDRQNLLKHSLGCMKLLVFENFAERNKLDLIQAEYLGDFPFNVHEELSDYKKYTQKVARLVINYGLNRVIRKYPNRFFSSGIIAILKK